MGTKLKKAAKNAKASWKSTLLGLAIGAANISMAAMSAQAAGQSWNGLNYMQAGLGVAFSALGAVVKDADVTGTAQ